MALVFQRRLAIPLWAIAFFTVALTAPPTATLFLMPPTTVFALAAVGFAAIVFLMPGAARLAAVAAYAVWTVDHDRRGRQGKESRHDAAGCGDLPTERLGGRP